MHLLRDQMGQWVYPVHRLDRPTSGVLLFALSEEAARRMGERFETQQVRKTYQAIVRGHIKQEGAVNHPLKPLADFKRDKKRLQAKPAQSASTGFKRLGTFEWDVCVDKYPTARYSWVELHPKTGRKHQLRRHLKHLSHPIIGDPKYGKSAHNRFFTERFGSERLLLAATELSFEHPFTGREVLVKQDVDGVFQAISQQCTLAE